MELAAQRTKKRRIGRVILIQLTVLLATTLVCEVAWRVVLSSRGKAHSAATASEDLERIYSTARDFVPRVGMAVDEVSAPERALGRYLHPFLGWENIGAIEQIAAEWSRLGNPEFESDVEILTVGGSVADMFGHFGIPRLEERLRADPRFANKRFYWYRYARGGFKQPQQVNMLNWFLGQGYTPEIVINMDGFNESALSMDNVARGTSPLYPSIPHWGSLAIGGVADRVALDHAARGRAAQQGIESLTRRALKFHVPWSAIATTFVVRRLNSLSEEARNSFETYTKLMRAAVGGMVLRGPPFSTDPVPISEGSSRMWAECSRNMRSICEQRGIFYLHVLQPTLHDPGAKVATKKELEVGGIPDTWKRGVVLGYPRLRALGAELARDGENFVDASDVFRDVERTLYIDNCHFREDGNVILADRIAEEFLKKYPTR